MENFMTSNFIVAYYYNWTKLPKYSRHCIIRKYAGDRITIETYKELYSAYSFNINYEHKFVQNLDELEPEVKIEFEPMYQAILNFTLSKDDLDLILLAEPFLEAGSSSYSTFGRILFERYDEKECIDKFERKYLCNFFGVDEIQNPSAEKLKELYDARVYRDLLYSLELVPGENMFEIDNHGTKNFLIKQYGKYKPNLTYIVKHPSELMNFKVKKFDKEKLNTCITGDSFYTYGEYFVSKKGTKCFRFDENGKHMLIEVDWGGAFDKSRGFEDKSFIDKALYYRSAASNGGGCGTDYMIIPKGVTNNISIDEI